MLIRLCFIIRLIKCLKVTGLKGHSLCCKIKCESVTRSPIEPSTQICGQLKSCCVICIKATLLFLPQKDAKHVGVFTVEKLYLNQRLVKVAKKKKT